MATSSATGWAIGGDDPAGRLYKPSDGATFARGIIPRWWLDPAYRYSVATFQPAWMSADQLTEGCLWARRLVEPRANCRTLRAKLGQRLGTVEPLALP